MELIELNNFLVVSVIALGLMILISHFTLQGIIHHKVSDSKALLKLKEDLAIKTSEYLSSETRCSPVNRENLIAIKVTQSVIESLKS